MISLVLCDVDGTLIPLGQRCASNRTVQAIERLKDAGVRFGLAAGRDVSELTKLFDGNTSVFDTGILSNGKRIMVDGELRRLTLVDTAALQQLADLVAPYGNTFAVDQAVVVSNASPAARAASRWCIGSCEDESVARALEDIASAALRGERPGFMHD